MRNQVGFKYYYTFELMYYYYPRYLYVSVAKKKKKKLKCTYVRVYEALGDLHIQRGLCEAPRGFAKPLYRGGFAHTYIHIYTQFSIFSCRYGWLVMKLLYRGASQSPYTQGALHIQKRFAKPLYQGRFVHTDRVLYTYTYFGIFPTDMGLLNEALYRTGFAKHLGALHV